MKTVIWHIFPLILVLYIINYIDRVNLGFAALTMNTDLGITPMIFGLVSGIFFIGYVLFEYPSNHLMERYGAKIWISRIILSWGIMVILLAFARSAFDIGVLRLLLGIAEAGFYPGIVFCLVTYRYMTNRPEEAEWLGDRERAWLIRTVKAERESHGTPVRRTPG